MSLQKLRDSIKETKREGSKFLTLEDGESFTAEFVDAKEQEDSKYGAQISFRFKQDGIEKQFNRSKKSKPTTAILDRMLELDIKPGDMVKVTRDGVATETKFKVDKADEKSQVAQKQDDTVTSGELDQIFK